jgi:hypothetical protein
LPKSILKGEREGRERWFLIPAYFLILSQLPIILRRQSEWHSGHLQKQISSDADWKVFSAQYEFKLYLVFFLWVSDNFVFKSHVTWVNIPEHGFHLGPRRPAGKAWPSQPPILGKQGRKSG